MTFEYTITDWNDLHLFLRDPEAQAELRDLELDVHVDATNRKLTIRQSDPWKYRAGIWMLAPKL